MFINNRPHDHNSVDSDVAVYESGFQYKIFRVLEKEKC